MSYEAILGRLLNLDHLRDWAARGLAQRAVEADRVRVFVSEEVERFGDCLAALRG